MVELMVATTLGLLLVAAIMQTFVSAKRTYEYQQALSRVQENGRFAIQFLSRDLRGADYWGCRGAEVSVSATAGLAASTAQGLDGADATGPFTPTAPAPVPDSLWVRGAQGNALPVLNLNDPDLTLDGSFPLSQVDSGDFKVAGDCDKAVVLEVASVATVSGNTQVTATADINEAFGDDAMLLPYRNNRYRIEPGTGSAGEPALVRNGDELVQGIENLQLLYGEDTSGDRGVDSYVPASSVSDMANVRSVQVMLVARSLRDGVTDQPQTYEINGTPINPDDRRLRKVFSTTLTLRNRLD